MSKTISLDLPDPAIRARHNVIRDILEDLVSHKMTMDEAVKALDHMTLALAKSQPRESEVTTFGKEYLEQRVSSTQEAVDREEWRQNDGEASRPEYWIGRQHEAKIALSNLTNGLERRGDYFGRPTPLTPA